MKKLFLILSLIIVSCQLIQSYEPTFGFRYAPIATYTAGQLTALDASVNPEVMFAYMSTFDSAQTGNYLDESGNGRHITETANFMPRDTTGAIVSGNNKYFDLPNVAWQTLIIFFEGAPSTTGMLFKGNGTPTALQCNFTGASTGSYLGFTTGDIRRDGRPITMTNASYARNNGVRTIGASVIAFSPSSTPTAATRIGANGTNNILSAGVKIYAIVGLSVSNPSPQLFEDIHNRLVLYKGIGTTAQIPKLVSNKLALPTTYYNQGATQDATPGKIALFGNGAPANSLGVDGDRYVDKTTNEYYEKVSGSWGSPVLTLNLPSPYTPFDHLIHVGVVEVPATWNGYRYWLTITPYPYRGDTKENPSVFASNNGTNWFVPQGVTNPLVGNPGNNGYNADVDIIYNHQTNEMGVIYKEFNDNADIFKYKLVKSSDGFQTTTTVTLIEKSIPLLNGNEVAPTMFYDDKIGKWVIYSVWENPVAGKIIRRTSDNWDSGFDAAVYDLCVVPSDFATSDAMGSSFYRAWHINARRDDRVGGYVMLVGNSTTGGASGTHRGVVWTSKDGLNWYQHRNILLNGNGTGWTGSRATYQGCLLPTQTGYRFYNTAFSAQADGNLPRMGELNFDLQ